MSIKVSRSKRTLGLAAALGAAVAVWGGVQVFAAGDNPPASAVAVHGNQVKPAAPVVPGGVGKLVRTYVNAGLNATSMPGGGYPGGMVDIDSDTTIHCPAKPHQTCLLVVDTNVQVGLSGEEANRVFVLPYVDGGLISSGPYIGNVPGVQFAGFSWQDTALITPGPHTVITRVGTDETAYQPWFSVEYRVFLP